MNLFDSQIHGPGPSIPWPSGTTDELSVVASSELAVAAMDAAGVSGALVTGMQESVAAFAERFPGRFGTVPMFRALGAPPADTTALVAELAASAAVAGTRAVINLPGVPSRLPSLAAGDCDPYFTASAQHGLPVFLVALGCAAALEQPVRDHPDLVFVIDHLGLEPAEAAAAAGRAPLHDLDAVIALARFPNVVLKFSKVMQFSSQPFPHEDVWPRLRPLIDAFGVGRLMWGSDYTRAAYGYRAAIDFIAAADELTVADKQSLLSDSVRRWTRWPGSVAVHEK